MQRYEFKLRVSKQNKIYVIIANIELIQCYYISNEKISSLSSLTLIQNKVHKKQLKKSCRIIPSMHMSKIRENIRTAKLTDQAKWTNSLGTSQNLKSWGIPKFVQKQIELIQGIDKNLQ